MKKMKCIHPRIVKRVMAQFITDAMDERVFYEDCYITKFDFDREACKVDFETSEPELFPPEVKMTKSTGFYAVVSGNDEWVLEIGYNFDHLTHKGSKQFYKNFTNLCPRARGFANVTLSLLHELGHFETYDDIPTGYDRVQALKNLDKKYAAQVINWHYFKLPDEALATNWAIKWLEDADNRKLAKKFEKEFFACFA